MPNQTLKNNVQLEGLMYSCCVTESPTGLKTAQMILSTCTQRLNEGILTNENWLYHRVAVPVDEKMATTISELAKKCEENLRNYGNKEYKLTRIPVRLHGKIISSREGELFIVAEQKNVSFPRRSARPTMKNKADLTGEVMEKTYNDCYANVAIRVETPGRDALVRICIANKDNHRKWMDISNGKIKKGDIISLSGPLISKEYTDGDKKIFRCSVNINNYSVIKKTETEREQSKLGF